MAGTERGRNTLQADAVRQWLAGQRAAQAVIEEERRRWLARLDREEALNLYLRLVSVPGAERRDAAPSPVLSAIRRAVAGRAGHDVG